MDFQAFFTMTAIGAMTIVVALLSWTVTQVVRLSSVVTKLESMVADLQRRVDVHEVAQTKDGEALSSLKTSVAVLLDRYDSQTKVLEAIHNAVSPPPAPPARRSRAAK